MLHPIAALALLATAAAFQSCAVLTVDVDVYKGPLANHEDVQMEQLAVMAIGARPLLVRLRNDLEHGYREERKLPQYVIDDTSCYADENYVGDTTCLRSPDAETVNAILGLYLDRPPSNVMRMVDEGRRIFDEAVALRAELDDFESDHELWTRVSAALRKLPAPANQATVKAFEDALDVRPGAKYRDLKQLSQLVLQNETLPEIATATTKSATLQFEALTHDKGVAALVDTLLPRGAKDPNADLRDELTLRLARLGVVFHDGRDLMDRALLLALDFIREVATAQPPLENRAAILEAAIDVTVQLIDRKALLAALANTANDQRNAVGSKVLEELVRGLQTNGAQLDEARFATVDDVCRAWLLAQPADATSALKSMHVGLKAAFSKDPRVTLDLSAFDQPARRRAGIARALSMSDSESRSIERAFATFDALARLLGDQGLDQGRLRDGLIKLIEDYLKARNALQLGNKARDDVVTTRRKLTDGLVHFAEKILFVVNNDAVLRACIDKEHNSGCRESYVMVLESIGNSILTLDDELHYRWENENNARLRADRELRAANAAWRADPATMLDDIVRAVLGDAIIPETLVVTERATWRAKTAERTAKEEDHTKAKKGLDAALETQTVSAKAEADAKTEHDRLRDVHDAWKRDNIKKLTGDSWTDDSKAGEKPARERIAELSELFDTEWKKLLAQAHEESDDSRALKVLVDDLGERSKDASLEKKPRKDAITYLIHAVDTQLAAADVLHAQKTADRTKRDSEVATATGTELSAKGALDIATANDTTAKTAYDKAVTELKNKSAELIQTTHTSVLASVSKDAAKPSRERIVGVLTTELLDRASKASGAAQTDMKAAAEIVAAQPMTDLPDVRFPSNPTNPTQVLDQITATLRAALVVAKVKGQSASVAQLEDALKATEDSRSPMVYIRPPASYLRNSTPVNALQDNQLGENNELTSLVGRAWPFGGTDKGLDARLKTQRAIDQQFWQNINRVRVTGGGDTTYALVKDDIGNWYVKGYSGDPKNVIKGFESIALAAGSGAMGTNLVDRANQIDEAKRTGKPVGAKASPTELGRHVGLFANNYDDQTEADAKKLGEDVPKLADGVKASWQKLSSWREADELKTAGVLKKNAADLEALASEPAKPLAGLPTLPTEKGAKQAAYCVAVLSVAADYEQALLERVTEKYLLDDGALAGKRSAVSTKEGELTATEGNLSTAQGKVAALQQIAEPTPAVTEQLKQAQTERDTAQSAVDQAKAALSTSRAELRALESNLVRARGLVRDMRRSVTERVGGATQREIDKRIDAVDDYQTALQVLGQRPKDAAGSP